MTLPVILTAEAEADLDEAAQWYERRSPGLGVELVARVRTVSDAIGGNPDLYGVVHADLHRAPVRRFPYGVFYRTRSNYVQVIAVLHKWRDPSEWLKRI